MKFRYALIVVFSMLLIGVGTGYTQPNVPLVNTPDAIVMRYVNAINCQNYRTAYDMLQSPAQTYDDFVAGYADTVRIVPYMGRGGVAAGSLYITTVLLGYQTDGTVKSYYGYYRLVNGGNFDPPIDGYLLSGGSFQLIKDGDALDNATIKTLVTTEWRSDIIPDLPSSISVAGEMSQPAATTILNYYDLINHRDFETAYDQWLTPNRHGFQRDYRLPYSRFALGYEDTTSVIVYAGASQTLTNGLPALPAVMVSDHVDGAVVTYHGCYLLGNLTATEQGIIRGRFTVMEEPLPSATAIIEDLDIIDCSSIF